MMLETCKRQQVRPNPATESSVFKLWDLLSERGNIKLFVSEFQGKALACRMVIPFGRVLYDWKVGWTGDLPNLHATHLLVWEVIKWGKGHGCLSFDFMGISNRTVAKRILQGEPFHAVAEGQDLFKMTFGGGATLLPCARTHISNPFLAVGYRDIYPQIRRLRTKIDHLKDHLRNHNRRNQESE
jgi:hypothetical protein